MTVTSFEGFGLAEPLLRSLKAENHILPTPIQVGAIPHLLSGRDLLGIAQTGSGKTAAFALPILQRLAAERAHRLPRRPRVLMLAPTRELACQIDERLRAYGHGLGLKTAVVLGGVGQGQQVRALQAGVDILVATPGRLLDLYAQRHVGFDNVAVLVLDEADRMLDMGFIRDVRKIVAACPKARQTLLFSATMPAEIAKLSAEVLRDAVRVDVAPVNVAAERIQQGVHFVTATAKRALLIKLLAGVDMQRVLVFTRTKRGADRVCRMLQQAGVSAEALHGNKAQNARVRALDGFRNGRVRVLVATDIAARGIDVPGVSHVINYELPNEPESYVHRIGRTARAGAEGVAIAFCDPGEHPYLQAIERLMDRRLDIVGGQPMDGAPVAKQPQHRQKPARTTSPRPRRWRGNRPRATAASTHSRPRRREAYPH